MGGLTLPPAATNANKPMNTFKSERGAPMPLPPRKRSDDAAYMGTDKNTELLVLAQASKHREV